MNLGWNKNMHIKAIKKIGVEECRPVNLIEKSMRRKTDILNINGLYVQQQNLNRKVGELEAYMPFLPKLIKH